MLSCAKLSTMLINVLENAEIHSQEHFRTLRRDAEKVHNEGFYFVDIIVHRALLLVLIEEKQVRVVWAGNHQEYERILKTTKTASRNG